MAKKEIKRNIKKNLSNKKVTETEDNFNKFVTTIAAIIIILILSYLIIGLFFTKEIDFKKEEETEETSEVSIDNNTITAGQIFDKKDESYYVVIYDVDSKLTNIGTFVSIYRSSEDSLPIYTVDSSNKLNSKFISEDSSNTNPTSYDDLKIKEPTLIKIENGSVSSYIENEDEIKAVLKGE